MQAIAGTIGIFQHFARLVRESSGAKAASIQLGKRFSGWGECSLTGANGRSHLYFRADCSSRLVDSRSGNFERDRGFALRLTLPG